MKLRQRLKTPTALGMQGFLAGAFLFFTVHPLAEAPEAPPVETGAMEISIPA